MPEPDHTPGAAHMLPGITCTTPEHCPPPGADTEPEACPFCKDLRALFDLQQTRMDEAIARWRAEDPTNREYVLPDLGALLTWLMAEADRARAALDLGPTDLVPAAELAAIPEGHRRTVARWLAGKATMLRPSFLFSERVIYLARDVLKGAAVDLVDPTAEDSTIDHAAEVLHGLTFQPHDATASQQQLLELVEQYATARAAQVEELHASGDPALLDLAEREAQTRMADIRAALGMPAEQPAGQQ